MTASTTERLVSTATTSTPPPTTTVSFTCCSGNSMTSEAVCPTSTATSVRRASANPGAVTTTSMWPGGSPGTTNAPSASVVAWRVVLVSPTTIETVADGTPAPPGSRTTPRTVDEGAWAKACSGATRIKARQRGRERTADMQPPARAIIGSCVEAIACVVWDGSRQYVKRLPACCEETTLLKILRPDRGDTATGREGRRRRVAARGRQAGDRARALSRSADDVEVDGGVLKRDAKRI